MYVAVYYIPHNLPLDGAIVWVLLKHKEEKDIELWSSSDVFCTMVDWVGMPPLPPNSLRQVTQHL